MGYIDRQFDGTLYHYARANGSNGVFWTNYDKNPANGGVEGYNTTGTGSPVRSLVDVYHREVVHVLSGNYVLVYKRATKHSATPVTDNVWRWHAINSIAPAGTAFKADAGNGRVFRALVSSSVTPTYTTRQSTDYGATSYREELRMPMTSPVWSLEVLQVTDITNPTMTAVVATPTTDAIQSDATFRGVTLKDATPWKHFVWSTSTDGLTPATMKFYIFRSGANDVIRIFNLRPGQEYLVTESVSGLGAGYYRYSLLETFNTGFTANTAGIIEFTPAQLGTIGIIYYNVGIDDITTSNSDSVVSRQVAFNVGIADEAVTNSADVVGPSTVPGSVSSFVTVTDDDTTTTNTDDAIQLSANIHISDSGGTTSDEVTVDLVGGPPSTRREKRIDGPIASLVPNEDLSIQFFVCEPSDGVFYSKLDDADDTDFVRPIPTPSIQFSELRLGLTGASGNVSTVRSVQFALKLRDASFTSVNNPIVKMDLYKSQDLGERITGYDIQLYGTETSVWLRSPVISVSINKIDVPNLVLRIRPRASDYAFVSYKATISAAMVDVSGDAPEKVIG